MKIKWYQVHHNKLSVQQDNCEIQLVYFWSAGGWTQGLMNMKHAFYHPATLGPSVVRSHEGTLKSYLVLHFKTQVPWVPVPHIHTGECIRTRTHMQETVVPHQHTSLQGTPTWSRQEKKEFKAALATWWIEGYRRSWRTTSKLVKNPKQGVGQEARTWSHDTKCTPLSWGTTGFPQAPWHHHHLGG